jgi:hypothetical protein
MSQWIQQYLLLWVDLRKTSNFSRKFILAAMVFAGLWGFAVHSFVLAYDPVYPATATPYADAQPFTVTSTPYPSMTTPSVSAVNNAAATSSNAGVSYNANGQYNPTSTANAMSGTPGPAGVNMAGAANATATTGTAARQSANTSSQTLIQPPPGGSAMTDTTDPATGPTPSIASSKNLMSPNASRLDSAAGTSDRPVFSMTPPDQVLTERPVESTWYFRLESFHWNERYNGSDFVNEYGPMSTLGYTHRNGPERFRLEIFGGTMAYDGGVTDGYTYTPYHQSNGTNYLGGRAEYDLLIEPSFWQNWRLALGLGMRFWNRDIRDLEDVPGYGYVPSYQETWWTLYPYIGIETKTLDQNAFHFFGSARIGCTPLTYQYINAFSNYYKTSGTVLYPKCGVTAQAELGVACRRFTLSAFTEVMTWTQSEIVRDSLQPDSSMFTYGSRISYSF